MLAYQRSAESAWDRLLGGLVWRQQQEAFGLRRWPVAASPALTELDWQQRNAARQIQLWAISRSSDNTIRQVSSSPKIVESLDRLAARSLYGAGMNTIDAALMDRLAFKISAREIGTSPQEVLEALTLLQSSLGDYRHFVPRQGAPSQIDAKDGYRAMYARKLPGKIREGWVDWCMSLIGATDRPEQVLVVTEAMRTLAMLEPASPSAIEFCLSKITDDSHPTFDLHSLVVLSSCQAMRTAAQSAQTAKALPALLTKVEQLGLNTDNSWTKRLEQIFKQLVQRDPAFPNYLIRDGEQIESTTVFWLQWCPISVQSKARSKINMQLASLPVSAWSEELVRFACKDSVDERLLRRLRAERVSPPTLLALELLSKSPTREDYPLMLDSLANGTRDILPFAWKGLSRMPTEKPTDELRTLAILWGKLRKTPLAEISSASLVMRLRTNAWKLKLQNVPTKDQWDDWTAFFSKNLDEVTLSRLKELDGPPPDWFAKVKVAAGMIGDASRGEAIFQRAKCNQCHGSGNALGPSLAGITRRFSNEDLFRAIYEPSRDVPDRYRSVNVLTTDGEVLVGMMVYESSDGVTLQGVDGKLLRINQADIESKSNSAISIMPSGLLDAAGPTEIADLYAYLKRL
jgi:putative heme-binding domain-containing protein